MKRPTHSQPDPQQRSNVVPFYVPPELSLTELRWRYYALGELRDASGLGVFVSHYQTFDGFLRHGPLLSARYRRGCCDPKVLYHSPGLLVLALEAWPRAPRP